MLDLSPHSTNSSTTKLGSAWMSSSLNGNRIHLPSDRFVDLAAPNTPIKTALGMADDVLIKGIQGITGILNNHGLLNIDFSHISKLMKNGGGVYISIGYGQGNERIISAIKNALMHPLLEKTPIHQAQGIIIKLTGDLKINEIDLAIEYLKEKVGEDTEIIPVVEQTETGDDQVMVSILLTGIGATPLLSQDNYQHKPTKLIEQDYISVNNKENLVYSKSVEDYEDTLEVPAFLRKGYNLNKTY